MELRLFCTNPSIFLPYSSLALTSASAFMKSSTMPSIASRAASIRGVVPSCILAFSCVIRLRSRIWKRLYMISIILVLKLRYFREKVNTTAIDVLAPCIARSAITSLDIDYAGLTSLCPQRGRISITCAMSVWRNHMKCNYIFMFPKPISARQAFGFFFQQGQIQCKSYCESIITMQWLKSPTENYIPGKPLVHQLPQLREAGFDLSYPEHWGQRLHPAIF